MAKNIGAGGVDFTIRANKEQLRADLEDSKKMVKQAAQEMSATTNLSIAAPTDLGATTAARLKPGNVQKKMDELQKKAERQQEAYETEREARRQLGMPLGYRDRKDAEAQRVQIAAAGRRQWEAAMMGRAPSMGDIEDAARFEAKAGKKLSVQEPARQGNFIYSSAYAAAIALAYFAKEATNIAVGIRNSGIALNISRERLAGIASHQVAFGISGENAGVAADYASSIAQYNLSREEVHQNAPFAFLRNLVYSEKYLKRQQEAELAQQEAAATNGALSSQSALRVRLAATRGDYPAFKQQQAEQMRDISLMRARFPKNDTLKDLENQTRDTQSSELDIKSRLEFARRQRVSVNTNATEYSGAESLANLTGNSIQAFAARRAREKQEMEQQFQEKLAPGMQKDERDLIEKQLRQARANFSIESRLQMRDLTMRPSGREISTAEVPLLGAANKARYWGDQLNTKGMADDATRQLTDAMNRLADKMDHGTWIDEP